MRTIALDVHRSFAQMAILDKTKIRDAGRIDLERSRLLQFAMKLKPDEMVIEATCNTSAIVRLLSPFVGRVVIANPILVRAIAWAKVKTDKIDAAVLAKLHASGFLPEVWMPDKETETRRRVVAERTQLVSQMTQKPNPFRSARQPDPAPCSQSGAGLGWRLSRSPSISAESSFAMPVNSIALVVSLHK
ncbi:transposase [Mesorhizobium sp. M1004]|uniref:IS110 family transposase n=1 Tax=Mesorhizobium sp. M1004 TaxID=2957046 RepID=UPI003336273E